MVEALHVCDSNLIRTLGVSKRHGVGRKMMFSSTQKEVLNV